MGWFAALKGTMKNTRTAHVSLAAVAALLLGASLTGCDPVANALEGISPVPGGAADVPASSHGADRALRPLDDLPVKGRAPKTGYSRQEFGPAWSDTDHNGCDTRNDILARDLANETFKPGTNNCVVASGTLADRYTGTTIQFVRGEGTSSQVQIDHIVPLSDAWQKGAQQLTADQRRNWPTIR